MKAYVYLLAAVLTWPTAAAARQDYAAYEGADSVQIGTGGTKITKNGIDCWTSGTPPHKYQLLGILTDSRKYRALDGHVVGSKSIAEHAISVGGNAVIIANSSTKFLGIATSYNAYNGGNHGSGTGFSKSINRTTTQVIIIKYLDDKDARSALR